MQAKWCVAVQITFQNIEGYSWSSREGISWGARRLRRRVCAEKYGKYTDSSFIITAGERWRSGNAGITGSFCKRHF